MTLIARQAWETRRTANAANTGLDIARESLGVAQRMAVESVRARLDARAPRLRVVASRDESERARRDATGVPGQTADEWPADREFRLGADDSEILVVGCRFSVRNEGTTGAEVRIDGPVDLLWPASPPARIVPGRVTVRLAPGEADEGVVDRWPIECCCYPVEPHHGDPATWVLRGPHADPPVVTASVGGMERVYFMSKERNVVLDTTY